ncbi:MAG TPA: hypothetical protein VGZ73_01395 [Bryobacteraceae bacterium]|jgi:hypothetical protein|nr:hypothetical protein [Bryobacteraceae bacterium]
MPANPKVSARLQALIDKGLLDRLSVSFSSFCLDQMKDWELLFPAERGYFERLFGLLDRSSPEVVERVFAPVREIERKMGVTEKTFPKGQFTLEQVDFLNRNPYYSEWRGAITRIFAQLDPLLDSEVARAGHARLVIAIAPSQLPADPERMWTWFQGRGKRVALEMPERAEAFLPLLLTGEEHGRAPSIAELFSGGKKGGTYGAWIVEAGAGLSRVGTDSGSVVKYSYQSLEQYRQRLMKEVQTVVDAQEVPGPRQLSARLKQMKILASEGDLARDPILAEFARAILLSGNGTLLINNTFVEWATVQAVRRARPSVTVVGFGIRNKIKPFSSLLIYADQNATNPIPSQMDTLGSYVDLEVFWQYIWQEFEKYAEYRNNTAYLFVGDGMEEMLVVAPQDCPLLSAKGALKLQVVFENLKEWMSV